MRQRETTSPIRSILIFEPVSFPELMIHVSYYGYYETLKRS